MKILVLEDSADRVKYFMDNFGHYELTITECAFRAIEYLKQNKYDYIFLDNDLGDSAGEGLDVAKFLEGNVANSNYTTITIIHSWNTIAAQRMKSMLPTAVVFPFNVKNFLNLRLDITK